MGEYQLNSPLLILFLLSCPRFGVRSYWKLRKHFPQLQQIFSQPDDALALVPAASRSRIQGLLTHGDASTDWRQLVEQTQEHLSDGVTLISHEQNSYPPLLQQISDPPPFLFLRGAVGVLQRPQLAFVGSRNASPGGLKNAHNFARALAAAGLVITSGLALGIDGAAHAGALAAGGQTVAVMGTGIDRIYPRRNHRLAQEIVATGGLLVSEFMPGTSPVSANFPRRNRIVSGLSLGVLVVEAALKSGSLITARLALEQNREVFAIPGSIHNPQARGCHALIRDGATLVESALDIAQQLGHWTEVEIAATDASQASVDKSPLLDSEAEKTLWPQLSFDPQSVDELVEQTGLGVGDVMECLMGWELEGYLIQTDSGYTKA